MEHCYWDQSGKHQTLVDALNDKVPNFGYTTNPYVNLYLTAAHLYYDAYNNGACNIQDCYMRDVANYIKPYLPTFSVRPFLDCEYEKMEQEMDQVLEFVLDKDLSFPVYTIWLNYKENTLSRVQPAESDLNNWTAVTFGDADSMEDYCSHRIAQTPCRDVTDEIASEEGAHPKLDQVIQHAAETNAKHVVPTQEITRPEGR